MGKAMCSGCETLPDDTFLDAYVAAHAVDANLLANASGWDDYADYQRPCAAAMDLIEAGESLPWHLPYFYADIHELLHDWYLHQRYIIAAFVARHLLEALPDQPLDPDAHAFLREVATGQYRLPQRSARSVWPAPSEYYLSTLQWSMVPYALDAESDRRADIAAKVMRLEQGVEGDRLKAWVEA